MLKIERHIVLVAVIIVLTVFVFYRFSNDLFRGVKPDDSAQMQPQPAPAMKKEVAPMAEIRTLKVETKYTAAPGKVDEVRFILSVDKDGAVTEAQEVDSKTGVADEHMTAFSGELTKVLKGKKLSEVGPLDRVGTSSLTTKAFNGVLDDLKAQL